MFDPTAEAVDKAMSARQRTYDILRAAYAVDEPLIRADERERILEWVAARAIHAFDGGGVLSRRVRRIHRRDRPIEMLCREVIGT